MAMTMPVLQGGGRGVLGLLGESWMADRSHLLGHSAFTTWNRQGRAQRINYNKSKMISEHLD